MKHTYLITGGERDAVRSIEARSVRQVATQRYRHGVQAVDRHEGPCAAVHALEQAEHQRSHAGGRVRARVGPVQPGPRQPRRAPRVRGRRGAVGPLGRRQPGAALRGHLQVPQLRDLNLRPDMVTLKPGFIGPIILLGLLIF